jgi:hypothetical protein
MIVPATAPARAVLMLLVAAAAIASVFTGAVWITGLGGIALVIFLVLGWRRFTVGTWVPVGLSGVTLIAALVQGVPGDVLLTGVERAVFLGALMGLLGLLRAAATVAPEVEAAGQFLTTQPASRRYLSLSLGGHLFGVMINFGGLVLLLDMVRRSMDSPASRHLSPELREVRLRRMTVAVMRGFVLISLWSPLGFATNVILLTLPSLSYADFAPIGFASSFVFIAVGLGFDRFRYRHLAGTIPTPPPASAAEWRGVVLLLGHVSLLGGAIFVLYRGSPLTFQDALILLVPTYAVVWAAVSGRGQGSGPWRSVRAAASDAWVRMPLAAGEVGMFAAAGFLSIVLLAVVPTEDLRAGVAATGVGPLGLMLGLGGSIVLLALTGVNPIVSSSVLGAVAVQLALPGVSDLGLALAITGGWTVAIGLSPFLTTSILCSAVLEQPSWRIGLVWNGPYSLTMLTLWGMFLTFLVLSGAV